MIVLTPIVAALTYFLMLRAAAGDFVTDPIAGQYIEVRVAPIPVWQPSSMARDVGRSVLPFPYIRNYWWLKGDEIVLTPWTTSTPTPGRFMPSPSGARSLVRSSLSDSVFSIDAILLGNEVMIDALPGMTLRAERLPPGSVAALARFMEAGEWANALDIARTMERRSPGSPTARYWYIAMLSRAEQVEEARRRLAAWTATMAHEIDPHVFATFLLACTEVSSHQTGPTIDEARLDLYFPLDPAARPPATPDDLDTILDWVAQQAGRSPPPLSLLGRSDSAANLFLVPVGCARATMELLAGDRARAFDLLLGLYAVVQGRRSATWSAHGIEEWTPYLEEPILDVLSDLCLYAPMTAADLEAYWPRLEEAFSRRTGPRADLLVALPTLRAPPAPGATPYSSYDDPTEKYRERERKLQGFREAVRIRHFRLVRGYWPNRNLRMQAVGLLLPTEEPPIDPYAAGPKPLAYVLGEYGVSVLSGGPDGAVQSRDAEGKERAIARSDLRSAYVPMHASMQFPRTPGHVYQSRKDFTERYPEGYLRGVRVSWVPPIVVWNEGPDRGVSGLGWRTLLPGLPVEVQYDPTNGLVSDGDVWTWLPVEGVAEWAPPDGISGAGAVDTSDAYQGASDDP